MVSCENLGNVTVLDLGCISQLLSFDPLRGKAGWEKFIFLVKIIWKTKESKAYKLKCINAYMSSCTKLLNM